MAIKEENRRIWADSIKERDIDNGKKRLLHIFLTKPGCKDITEKRENARYYYGALDKNTPNCEAEYVKVLSELLDLVQTEWGDKPYEVLDW